MAPAQFARQRRAFREVPVELPHVLEVAPVEALPVQPCQIPRKDGKQGTSVFRPVRTALLVVDDVAPRTPVGLHERGVGRSGDLGPLAFQQLTDCTDQTRIGRSRFDFGNDDCRLGGLSGLCGASCHRQQSSQKGSFVVKVGLGGVIPS